MHILAIKEAFIIDALEGQTGWHGRIQAGSIYISAVYEDRGLFVHTVERCLHFIPREKLQYEPGYDAMRLELQGMCLWPDKPKEGLPQGIKRVDIEVEPGRSVVDTLHEVTGLSKKEIKGRLASVEGAEGVVSFKAPKDEKASEKEEISFDMISGFTREECREGAMSRLSKGGSPDNEDDPYAHVRTRVQDLEEKATFLKEDLNQKRFKYPQLPCKETGFYSDVVEGLSVIPYESIVRSIDKDILVLKGLIVSGESAHNDEILDEYNKLMRQKAAVIAEWGL